MKTKILSLLFILISSVTFAQVEGVNFKSAIDINTLTEIEYEILVKVDNGYAIAFEQTPIGIKHCIEKCIIILEDNGLEFSNPSFNDVYLASYVENIFDYSSLDTSLGAGSSEVIKRWVTDNYMISFILKKDVYTIFIVLRN